jgi:hypothetical protein
MLDESIVRPGTACLCQEMIRCLYYLNIIEGVVLLLETESISFFLAYMNYTKGFHCDISIQAYNVL